MRGEISETRTTPMFINMLPENVGRLTSDRLRELKDHMNFLLNGNVLSIELSGHKVQFILNPIPERKAQLQNFFEKLEMLVAQ